MTKSEAIKRLQAIKSYMTSGNPMWSVEPVGEAFDMAIEALEQSQWIPCGERLPENSDTVLITHRGGVSFGWHNGLYWERGASTKHRPLQTVVAWMPLPEPYKGGE